MYSAIQDEVNKINDTEDMTTSNTTLEDEYIKLYDAKTAIENLDTNLLGNEMDDESFNKLRDLIINGNNIVDAYRNVLPVPILNRSKKILTAYADELIDAIVSADNAYEYRAGLDLIIKNLSVIIDGKEYTILELKDKLENEYN